MAHFDLGVFALEVKDDSGNDAPKFCSSGRIHKGPIAKELLGLDNKVQKKLKEPTLHVKNVLKGSTSSSKELCEEENVGFRRSSSGSAFSSGIVGVE